MLELLGYLATILMGIILGTVGGGGSILTVPILVYLMGLPIGIATGYSLLLVGSAAALGAYNCCKRETIDLNATLLFAAPSIIAVYLTRAYLMPALPNQIFDSPFPLSLRQFIMMLFACLMVTSAVMMLRKSKENQPARKRRPTKGIIVIEGAIVGGLTGLLGAGGGFLILPALVLAMDMQMKAAVGASLVIIALKSLIGFVGDLQNGIMLDFQLIGLMLLATFIGISIANRLASRLRSKTLQVYFAYFTVAIAVLILCKEFIG